ncbi:hypothetical protein M0R45_030333 [Rubus argutus]|uniref:Uncharacterized protein n=1 Tax=Rubus argutus TaxID=59490 RepID=A0AAW1WBJ7_RUBAR
MSLLHQARQIQTKKDQITTTPPICLNKHPQSINFCNWKASQPTTLTTKPLPSSTANNPNTTQHQITAQSPANSSIASPISIHHKIITMAVALFDTLSFSALRSHEAHHNHPSIPSSRSKPAISINLQTNSLHHRAPPPLLQPSPSPCSLFTMPPCSPMEPSPSSAQPHAAMLPLQASP